ncbi:NAD(P)/FAD-dependent oxidoreductase [Vibrio penaeicida]|uniref:NAD(P)/FAD-dependent oxidoreductase n=1 Tax=Vibrio penaeicida TaxID=104609 RepID=UPI000CEA4075|nr:FAD-dependent oxidoreductase [Vibrio penaeicida]
MSVPIVIIGAGYAGTSAAISARKSGFSGDILLYGAEAVLPYERPTLSKWGPSGIEQKAVFPESFYEEYRVSLQLGEEVIAIDVNDKAITTSTHQTVHYQSLILATGAKPRTLPNLQISPRVHYLRTLSDAQNMQQTCGSSKHVLLIGAGFIGLELAASLRAIGVQITVIERAPEILSRSIPPEIASVLYRYHVENGVTFHLGESNSTLQVGQHSVSISLGNGDIVEADHAIVGIGSIPNTQLADQAGILCEDGIMVDEQLKTSDPYIFAAGDCCCYRTPIGSALRLESWLTAGQQGTVAGANAAGEIRMYTDVPYFWSDQNEFTLQVAGYPSLGTTSVIREFNHEALLHFSLSDDGRLMCVSGIAKGNAIARDVRMAQKLISKGAKLDASVLADADVALKSLLK